MVRLAGSYLLSPNLLYHIYYHLTYLLFIIILHALHLTLLLLLSYGSMCLASPGGTELHERETLEDEHVPLLPGHLPLGRSTHDLC